MLDLHVLLKQNCVFINIVVFNSITVTCWLAANKYPSTTTSRFNVNFYRKLPIRKLWRLLLSGLQQSQRNGHQILGFIPSLTARTF